ncbi:MAG: alcohol dehydrogenase catalytic domain-containing protein [Pyrinomonadaceae bacterium]|nr:alcohol dehydrogenase catalytic domain-containing protein [Pyrinomonadaceae bacterium]MCX7639140.1 alcohol dehydrogenase catalytic domain-containing protein [Pyrinomonadaceae bacterium]MDW8303639.1 alcohol dehydrogenase catalytic domain-containing protein [Acidobacteriota bacterium]
MKALHFDGRNLALCDVEKPEREGEALVRVLKSGICKTDLEIIRGYAKFRGTLGHEFVGIVERAESSDWIGKRVVGEINVGCGRCHVCKQGDSRHCSDRTVLGILGRDGAHAEYLTLPLRNLLKVPDGVSDEEAVFVEPLSAAYAITEQVEILPETKVLVIGDGKLGLLCAMTLALKSKDVSILGKHKQKLDIAESQNINSILLESLAKLPKKSFDVVVEASGNKTGFEIALEMIKPRGKLVLKSTFHGSTKAEMWKVVVEEISIVGSRCGRFAPALELLERKQIHVTKLISEEFSINEGLKAFEKASQKGVLKVLISM